MSTPLPNIRELIEAYGNRTLPVWVEGDGYTLAGPPGTIDLRPLKQLMPEVFALLDELANVIELYGGAEVKEDELPEGPAQRYFAAAGAEMAVRGQRQAARLLANLVQRRLG